MELQWLISVEIKEGTTGPWLSKRDDRTKLRFNGLGCWEEMGGG